MSAEETDYSFLYVYITGRANVVSAVPFGVPRASPLTSIFVSSLPLILVPLGFCTCGSSSISASASLLKE